MIENLNRQYKRLRKQNSFTNRYIKKCEFTWKVASFLSLFPFNVKSHISSFRHS